MEKVIYLSFAQGTNIDGPKLAKSVSAVMVRAGQGTWEDPLFRQNYKICIDNKIPFGIWWFCQPNMVASYQVNAFMKVWNSLEVKPVVIAYDVEEIDYKDDDGIWKKLFPPSRQFNHDNVLKWCKDIKIATGTKVGIYTRKNYFESWTYETNEWYQFWMWIAAWYIYSGQVEPALPWNWTEYKIHQYEGGGQGTPGVDPAQTCKEYFNGTHTELLDFFGAKQEPVMTAIYNTTVPQTKRAKILTLEPTQKLVVPPLELNIDAVILPMGGMHNWDGSHWKIKTETTFAGRYDLFKNSNIPVLGRFDLDAGSMIAEQHGDKEFVGRVIRDNWILPYLLKGWLLNDFSWDTVLGKLGQYRKLSAIIISEVEVDAWPTGTTTNDYWQKLIFDYVVYHLKYLMDNGMAPKIPIIMYTGCWWLKFYPNQMAVELQNDRGWLYLQLGQWVRLSTATFNTLDEIFAFPPDESFKFDLTPDGYFNRILMHEFSGEAQKVLQITDATGKPIPINLSLWNDTKEEMYRFLAFEVILPSSPPSEIDFTVLDNSILAIEVELEKIKVWRNAQ